MDGPSVPPETVMQIVRSYQLGAMLGEATGATAGDVAASKRWANHVSDSPDFAP
jgi:hypothetical protein